VLESGEARTVDLGGEASTMEMTEAIIGQLPAR
jgi:isocitrate/isopropylmalate dehydrogenase